MKIVNYIVAIGTGVFGFLVGAVLGTRSPGMVAVVAGIILVLIPYFTLVSKLTSSVLQRTDASIGLFALRASNYLLIGGIIVVLLGLVSLLKLLPWL